MIELSFPLNGKPVPVHVPENEDDLKLFKNWLLTESQRGAIAVDTETTGLDIFRPGFRLRTVQFGTATEAWVIIYEWRGEFANAVRWALATCEAVSGFNNSYDSLVLNRHAGWDLDECWRKTIDVQILAILVDPRAEHEGGMGRSLKGLSAKLIDPDAPDTQEGLQEEFRKIGCTKATGWASIDVRNPTYLSYAGGDVILTSRLRARIEEMHREIGIRPALIPYEHEIARICAHMTRKGVLIDQPYVEELGGRLRQQEAEALTICARYGVTSPSASKQVAEALMGMGVELTERTDSGALKVDKAILTALAGMTLQGDPIEGADVNPLAKAVYMAKRSHKWRAAYVDKFAAALDTSGRIHPTINTLQARTGRMSVTGDLAAQTLPSSDWMIRRAVVGEPDEVGFSVDFAAVELRVLAALADVRAMKEAIRKGEDLHSFTARLVYGEGFTKTHRKICKGIGFGKVYGGGPTTISHQTGAPLDDVKKALSAYDRAYPEVTRASRRWQREGRAHGMVSVSVTGRRLPLDPHRVYAVTNYMVQSAARDVLGQALLNMDEAGLLPYLNLPIHDEVVGFAKRSEVTEIVREVERCMTMEIGGVRIDAEGEIGGRSWGSMYGASE